MKGQIFAKMVKMSSKKSQENESLTVAQTNSLQMGTRSSEYVWRQTRSVFFKTFGYSPLASAKKVDIYRKKIMVVKKEDWKTTEIKMYKNKQDKNKRLAQENTVLIVENLFEYIVKIAEGESEDIDLSMSYLPVCFDGDAGGGRFVATFAFLNRKDRSIVLHPILLFEGSDCRANLELTLSEFTESVRQMEGKNVVIINVEVKIKLYGLFDLAALNTIVGKQNHSSTYPCAWTNVSKQHLNSENHKNSGHTLSNCKSIQFLSINDFESQITHHAVEAGGTKMADTGKYYGSVVANNLLPLANMLRYVTPVMHMIMGETNNVLKELKTAAIKGDEATSDVHKNAHKKKTQERLVDMYDEQENLEAELSNVNLAEMVVLNDLKRVKLLLEDKEKEAGQVANSNYKRPKNKSNKKEQCDAEICLLFESDVENEWDAKFKCKNTCAIHVRCEGIALIEKDEEMPENYECGKCKNKVGNKAWLEKTLQEKCKELITLKCNLNRRITSQKAEIDFAENMETELSGPKQKLLKEAMKELGDVARYHGGDLQGKQVQKLLDNARNEAEYKLLECVSDDKETHDKFKKAIKILADISDAIKMPIEEFDEEDIKMIKHLCEQWGEFWPKHFPHRNITPKGHITSIVLPKIVEDLRTFYRFYKMEQKGEEIHAALNDLEKKAWAIRNKGAKLWSLIHKYELRNVTNVDIVNPTKRVFKDTRRMTRYI